MYTTHRSAEAVTTGVTVCKLTDVSGNIQEYHNMKEPIRVSVVQNSWLGPIRANGELEGKQNSHSRARLVFN